MICVCFVVVENIVWKSLFGEGIKHWRGGWEDLKENYWIGKVQILLCASNKKLQLFWNLKGGGAFAVPKLRLQIFLGFPTWIYNQTPRIPLSAPAAAPHTDQIRQEPTTNFKLTLKWVLTLKMWKEWKKLMFTRYIQSAESDSEKTFFKTYALTIAWIKKIPYSNFICI